MNADPAISALIREVLAEELSRLKPGKTPINSASPKSLQEETVSITNDADLQAFVARLLDLAEDSSKRQNIRQGRLVFKLANVSASAIQQVPVSSDKPSANAATVTFDKGFLSERQVDQLSNDTTRIQIGKRVTMTPLAKDRLRQRGIKIERTDS